MPDFMKGVEAFQQGSDWRQRFRANKQFEKMRDLGIEREGMKNFDLRESGKATAGNIRDEFGVDTPLYQHMGLEDPFAFKLMDWFKSRKGKKKNKKQAIDLGDEGAYDSSSPTGTMEAGVNPNAAMGDVQTFALDDAPMPVEDQNPGAEPYADGGGIDMEALNRKQWRQAQWELLKKRLSDFSGSAKDKLLTADKGIGTATGRAEEGAGLLSKAKAGAKRLGTAGALAGTAITTATTDTDKYRERFGLEDNDPSAWGDAGIRALGAASDLGSILTFGAADRVYRDKQREAEEAGAAQQAPPQQDFAIDPAMLSGGGGGSSQSVSSTRSRGQALPTASAEPDVADFSDLDIDAKDVPDMKTKDWVKYRLQALQHAARTGVDPTTAQEQVNDQITNMQIKGFLSYGQQGLMLQQAGNNRGAMAAYRAAFQYFPNGNDVEFGLHKSKAGRQQIVGVGVDEQTGKRVPGTEMIMDPERISVLMENFKNPQAFRMWTKDHRDEQFKERQYQEVTKPLAQATADYQANNSEANILRAENAQLRAGGGAGSGANMRTAEATFRTRLGELGMTDEATADFLASIMSQIKVANPSVPDNVIIQTIMTAQRDGTLQKRLAAMQAAQTQQPTQVQPRQQTQAIPTDEGESGDPAMAGLSPEEIDWANRPAQ